MRLAKTIQENAAQCCFFVAYFHVVNPKSNPQIFSMPSFGQNFQLPLKKICSLSFAVQSMCYLACFDRCTDSCAQAQAGKVAANEITQLANQINQFSFFSSMFSHAVQACGTASTSRCLYALSPPSEELLFIPSLSIPSHSPALGGSGKIPETVSWDQRGAGPGWGRGVRAKEQGQGSIARTGRDQELALGWRRGEWGGVYGDWKG